MQAVCSIVQALQPERVQPQADLLPGSHHASSQILLSVTQLWMAEAVWVPVAASVLSVVPLAAWRHVMVLLLQETPFLL